MLAVLLCGGGADDLDLAARQGRLEDGGRVDGALCAARADEGVHLVDEENDIAVLAHLLDYLLEALLELAAVLGAGDKGAHVEHADALAAQDVRHLAVAHQLGQALDHSGLAHAGLADEQGVVLGAAREDLHQALRLVLAADDRVELAVGCARGEVGRELLEHGLLALAPAGMRAAGTAVHDGLGGGDLLHELFDGRAHSVCTHPKLVEGLERHAVALADDA